MRDRREGERGAALLTVLLLVAVISVLAGVALEKLRIATRLAANSAQVEQARAFTYAAETLAVLRIDNLLAADAARTTLIGDWNGTPYPVPIPGGLATLTVRDGGNCFNLNGLVTETGPGTYTYNPVAVRQFVRLMRLIDVPGGTAEGIAAAAADWIDSDGYPIPNGAEDSAYQGKDPGYRTAGTLMADPSELRAVAGMTPEIYDTLKPWICALPSAELSKINVNTLLPEQAPLFAMLMEDDLDVGRARALLLARPPQGFSSVNAFGNSSALGGKPLGPGVLAQTDVRTHWFSLAVEVTTGGAELDQTALIDATEAPARVVSRQWGDSA